MQRLFNILTDTMHLTAYLGCNVTMLLPDAHNMFDRQLVELLVVIAALPKRIGIERGLLQLAHRLGAVALAQQIGVRRIVAIDLLQQLLDLRIGVEAARLLLEYIVRAHTAEREVPYSLLILSAVGVRVEVAWTIVASVLQQPDQEEQVLNVLAAEAQILVETRPLLIVEINVEEFACFERLGHAMHKVEARHILVRDLGIESDHVGMIERVDEGEHVPDGWKIGIGARLVRLGFQGETEFVAPINSVLTQEIDRIAHTFDRHNGVLAGLGIDALASAPEDIGRGTQLHAQVDRLHCLLQRERPYAWRNS